MRFDFCHDPPAPVLARLRDLRLAPALYPGAIACVTAIAIVATIGGAQSLRERHERGLEVRAQARFESGRGRIERLHVATESLDRLLRQDRTLRDLRRSGSLAVLQIARIGDALPDRTRLTALTMRGSKVELKGDADDLATLVEALAKLGSDREIGKPSDVSLNRDERELEPAAQTVRFALRVSGP